MHMIHLDNSCLLCRLNCKTASQQFTLSLFIRQML